MSAPYEGTISELKYIGGDDYEVALDWIRKAGWPSLLPIVDFARDSHVNGVPFSSESEIAPRSHHDRIF